MTTSKESMKKEQASATSTNIVFVHGDKGGVGKSFTSARLIDLARTTGIDVAVVDGDTQNPDIARMWDGILSVKSCNLRSKDGWFDITDFVFEQRNKTTIISMPAGIGPQFKDQGISFCESMKKLGVNIHLLWVLNRLPDSINLLHETLATAGHLIDKKFAVKNLVFGESAKFARWQNSETRSQFEKSGGLTLELLELDERVVDKLFGDAQNVMPFSNCTYDLTNISSTADGQRLSPSENLSLTQWLAKTAIAFDPVIQSLKK